MSPQPWECPRCHRINAPHTPSCFCQPAGAIGPAQTAPNDSADYKRFLDMVGRGPLTAPIQKWPNHPSDPVWMWHPQNTTFAAIPPGTQCSYTRGGSA